MTYTKEQRRDWYHNRGGKERVRAGSRKWLYGLTREAYTWMLEQQGGACALCPDDAECVDHDHTDGAVRAVLCRRCNTAVGQLEGDIQRAARTQNYVRIHQ